MTQARDGRGVLDGQREGRIDRLGALDEQPDRIDPSSSAGSTTSGSGTGREGTRKTTSPGIRSAWRLVARIRSPGQPRSSVWAMAAHASTRCSRCRGQAGSRGRAGVRPQLDVRFGLPFADVEHVGDGLDDQGRLADRREFDEPDAVVVRADLRGGGLDREPGLARAAGPGQGQCPGAVQEPLDLVDLAFATDETAQLDRQVVRSRRTRRRLSGGPVVS